jgi:hypothetical protein
MRQIAGAIRIKAREYGDHRKAIIIIIIIIFFYFVEISDHLVTIVNIMKRRSWLDKDRRKKKPVRHGLFKEASINANEFIKGIGPLLNYGQPSLKPGLLHLNIFNMRAACGTS